MNNHTNFTKGPWLYSRSTDGALVELGAEVNHQSGDGIIYMQNDHGNAQLIACAPEMYEMLDKILCVYELDYDDTCKALDLLAKARGEQ